MRQTDWTAWATETLVPLSTAKCEPPWDDLFPVGEMIGDATVVALGEDVHCAAEPLEFRNRLCQYLVREKGFTAIAIESGIAESRLVHEYVRGGAGDLDTVLARGIGWTFDRLPQNRALIEWLRAYNADPAHARKVNFYGFDVPGSPGNSHANRGVETAVAETLLYLDRVDPAAAAGFRARLGQTERDALTATIADMNALIERREGHYAASSTPHDYAWACRAAVGARQVDNWLRQYCPEQIHSISAASDVRDRAQADNLDWIIEQEGPAAKILVFAHWAHLSSTPLKMRWPGGEECEQQVAGTYLRRRLGDQLLVIGNLIGRGKVKCGSYEETLAPAAPESIAALAGEVDAPLYLLDLRKAPEAVRSRLQQEDDLGHGPVRFVTAIGKAFDVLLYIDTVTPACV